VIRIAHLVAEMRRDARVAIDENDFEAAVRASDLGTQLSLMLEEALKATSDSEGRKNLTRMQSLLRSYEADFSKAVSKEEERTEAIDQGMNPLGAKARTNLTEIIRSAMSQEDYPAAAHAGIAQEALMLARISALRFIANDDKTQIEEFARRLEAFKEAATRLQERLTDPAQQALAAELVTLTSDYAAAFAKVVATTAETHRLVNGTMAETAGEIGRLSRNTSDSQHDALAAMKDETIAKMKKALVLVLSVSALALLFGIAFAVVLSRAVAGPVTRMTAAMKELADGNRDAIIPGLGYRDEIGSMAEAVQVFKNNAIEKERLEAAQEEQKRRADEERKLALRKMADGFESQVGIVVDAVTSAAVQLQASSRQMAATETSAQATSVAGAAGQASANVQTVASATDELAASINEIASQVERSRTVAVRTDTEARETTELIQRLSDAVVSIGEIVTLINGIASQTNLLALNATIEAARAGEAGKGFAIVAHEVKALANQTAGATAEIANQVSGIQEETRLAVQAMHDVAATVDRVREIAAAIADSVRQQSLATHEIARSMAESADSTREMTGNLGSVSAAIGETDAAAGRMTSAAASVGAQVEILRTEALRFTAQLKAGS
jgi:methyl-accepting chemotaxis protein